MTARRPLSHGRGQAAPLRLWEFRRVGGENLDTHVIGAGRPMLVNPAQDGLLITGRDDRGQQSVADGSQIVGVKPDRSKLLA